MANATVNTRFTATDRVTKTTRKMTKSVNGFSRNAQRSFRGIGDRLMRMRGLLVGAGAALVGGKIAQGIVKFTEAGDEINKTARQLGIGTEALQEFRFAAERQGVSTDNLEKSLKAMNNRLGLLRNEQGQLNTLLKDTNPELREQLMNADDSEEAFTLLMKAMNEAGTAAERTALAQAAFSSSGRELVRMSEAGVDGINALREEARKYGNVISEEAAAKSEKFQDSMTNLKSAMEGVRNRALTPLIEKLTPLIDRVSAFVAENKELISQKIEQWFEGVRSTVQTVVKLWDSGLIPAVLAGVVAFKAITIAIAAYKSILAVAKAVQIAFNVALTANPIGAIIAGVAALVAGIVLLIKNWDKVKVALNKVWGVMKAFGNWIAGIFKPIIDGIVNGFGKVADFAGNIISKVGGLFGGGNSGGGGASRSIGSTGAGAGISRSETVSRSVVDLNVNDPGGRTSVRQSGKAPGVRLQTGAGATLD